MQLTDRLLDHWGGSQELEEDIEIYPLLKYTVVWDEANTSPPPSP